MPDLDERALSGRYFAVALGPLTSPEQVLSRCAAALGQAYRISSCRIFLWQDESRQTAQVAAEATAGTVGRRLRRSGEMLAVAGHPFLLVLSESFQPFVFSGFVTGAPGRVSGALQTWAESFNVAAFIAMPLTNGITPIGFVTIESEKPREWTEAEIAFLGTVASHIVSSLETARHAARLEGETHRLNVLNEITRSLNASLTTDEVFRQTVNLTHTLVEFELASLLLLDDRSRTLKLHRQARREQSWFSFGEWVSPGFSLCGHAIAHRRIVRIDDVSHPPANLAVRSDWGEAGYSVCVIVPLLARGKEIGTVIFFRRSAMPFSDTESDALGLIGEQVAAAIQRIQLFDDAEKRSHVAKQVARREELINRIGMAISSQVLRPEMVLQHAVEALGASLDVDCCYIARCGRDDAEAVPSHQYHRNERFLPRGTIVLEGNPSLQRVLRSQEPIIFGGTKENTSPESDHLWGDLTGIGVRSALYCALLVRDQVVGFVGLHEHAHPREWTEDDISLVRAVARQIALALGNAQLFLESERSRRELASLFDMSRVLSSYTDLSELFSLVTQRVARTLGGEMCLIALWDKQAGRVEAQSPAFNVPFQVLRDVRFPFRRAEANSRISGEVRLDLDGPERVPHPTHPYFSNQADRDDRLSTEHIRAWGIHNLMVSPLRNKGEVVGFIYLANRPSDFTAADLQLLEIFAGQAAEAIVNAQLFEQLQERAQREAVLNRILTTVRESLDPDTIMHNVVEQLGRALDVDRCVISLYNAAQKVWHGALYEYVTPTTIPIKDNEMVRTNRLTLNGEPRQPLTIADLAVDPLDPLIRGHEKMLRLLGTRALMLVPIVHSGTMLGTIGFHHCRDARRWTKDDIDLAETIATQLSVAIQNAALFRRVVASQQQWQASFDAMTDGIALLDAEGTIVQANQSLARLSGHERAEHLTGKSAWDLLVPPNDFVEEHPIAEVYRTKVSVQVEFTDPGDRTLRETVDPILDEEGHLIGLVLVVSDVTHERRAEQEIRQRNRELSALNAIAEEITKSLEIDQIISSAFERTVASVQADAGLVLLFDEQPDAAAPGFIPRPVAYHGLHPSLVLGSLGRILAGGGFDRKNFDRPVTFERLQDSTGLLDPALAPVVQRLDLGAAITVPLESKNRILGIMIAAFRNGRTIAPNVVDLLTAVGRQVGVALENAQLIASLQDALVELREASRLKDEFLATLSHELRTPLTAVTGWAEVLNDRLGQEEDPELVDGIRTIHGNAEALQKLINDMLDLSRIENRVLHLDLEETDVGIPIQAAVQTVRQMAESRGVALTVKNGGALPRIKADIKRLQQVFWNLLTNAIKFTEPGGIVKIESRRKGTGIAVRVTDTGLGIDASFLPYVFDRFRQADGSATRRFGGLGIGLSLVKSFTEAHGGTVHVKSAGLGRGATFTVELPGIVPTVPVPEFPTPTAIVTPRSGDIPVFPDQILIVDSVEENVRVLESALKRQGYATTTVTNAESALRLAERIMPDVILAGLGMPGLDGFEVFHRLRAVPRLATTPIIAILGVGMEAEQSRALAVGFHACVKKPFRPRQIIETVKSVLERK